MTGNAGRATAFDFDQPIERRGTDSFKWAQWGPEVLPLWIADMDFEAPPPVLDALRGRLDHGVLGYGMITESLGAAICDYHRNQHGWNVESDWLVFVPSIVPAITLACRAFSEAGEGVMVIAPVYPPFLDVPRVQNRETILVHSEIEGGRWTLPLDAMENAVTDRTRVLLFCHPHNPLGRAWSLSEVQDVVDFCRHHDLVLCSDEIHSDLRLDDVPHMPAALAEDAASITLTMTSPSKA